RQHVAPEVRRGGIAVQQQDGVGLSHLHVCHLAPEDPPPVLLVRNAAEIMFASPGVSRLSSAHGTYDLRSEIREVTAPSARRPGQPRGKTPSAPRHQRCDN